MSVALIVCLPPGSARSSTWDRIGIVVRRSTTLWTWPSALRRAALSMVSFMADALKVADWTQLPSAPRTLRARGLRRDRSIPWNGRRTASFGGAGNGAGAFFALALEHPAQQLDVLRQRRIALDQLLDLFDRMDHGGVVAAAEFAPDFGQGARGQLLGEVHRDLARAGDDSGAPARCHFGQLDVEMLGDPLLDRVDRHP